MRWTGELSTSLESLLLDPNATILDALRVIERGGQSIAFVCDDERCIIGSLTDGDVRRALVDGATLDSASLPSIMSKSFTAVGPEVGRAEVLDLMHARGIGQLPVLDEEGRLIGLHTIGQILTGRIRENCAVVLAGGKGTRLHPLTETTPKPMVTVAGRPILERIVLHLMSSGFRRIFISVNHLAHVIEDHFGDGAQFGCSIEYLREQEPLGTGGPLSLLDPVPDLPLLVLNGDLVTQFSIENMLAFHERGRYFATFGLKPYRIEIPFGVADVDGDRLVGLQEKPVERRLINAGVYLLSPHAVRLVPKGCAYPITDLFGRCLEEGRAVGAHVISDDWIDIGRQAELQRARGEG